VDGDRRKVVFQGTCQRPVTGVRKQDRLAIGGKQGPKFQAEPSPRWANSPLVMMRFSSVLVISSLLGARTPLKAAPHESHQ
jgi:hypothetical protein